MSFSTSTTDGFNMNTENIIFGSHRDLTTTSPEIPNVQRYGPDLLLKAKLNGNEFRVIPGNSSVRGPSEPC